MRAMDAWRADAASLAGVPRQRPTARGARALRRLCDGTPRLRAATCLQCSGGEATPALHRSASLRGAPAHPPAPWSGDVARGAPAGSATGPSARRCTGRSGWGEHTRRDGGARHGAHHAWSRGAAARCAPAVLATSLPGHRRRPGGGPGADSVPHPPRGGSRPPAPGRLAPPRGPAPAPRGRALAALARWSRAPPTSPAGLALHAGGCRVRARGVRWAVHGSTTPPRRARVVPDARPLPTAAPAHAPPTGWRARRRAPDARRGRHRRGRALRAAAPGAPVGCARRVKRVPLRCARPRRRADARPCVGRPPRHPARRQTR